MKHVVFLILFFVVNVNSLKLLLIFNVPGRSHYIIGNELGKGLAKLGHEVTMLSPFEEKNPPKNYKQIVLPETMKFGDSGPNDEKVNMFKFGQASLYLQMFFLSYKMQAVTDAAFNHGKVQHLIKSNASFDAVIVEQFWNDALKVFAHHYNAPLIIFSALGPNKWVNNFVGNPENPSYVPNTLLSISEEMTFSERLNNLVFGVFSDLLFYGYFYPSQNTLAKKYFPNAPHLDNILFNTSLVLVNHHESYGAPVPQVPNMISIGGFHVNPPKELPKDIKEFMDNAKEGVIYFSLGSNVQPSQMPKDKKDVILKVLGSRKERVLWKWDEDQMENAPGNMMISKWFPQQGILAHPNCKLFISHGGLLSTIESVSLGIPVLALPVFGDQELNAATIRAKKIGKSLSFSQLSEEQFRESLNEVLENPIYRKNARKASKIIHDRPIKPIEVADYWIRYVVRHKGAPHLRVAGTHLALYKYYMLDVFAVILAGLISIIYFLKKICGLCCKRKNEALEKSVKRKAKRE